MQISLTVHAGTTDELLAGLEALVADIKFSKQGSGVSQLQMGEHGFAGHWRASVPRLETVADRRALEAKRGASLPSYELFPLGGY